jgi:hypothetical protein
MKTIYARYDRVSLFVTACIPFVMTFAAFSAPMLLPKVWAVGLSVIVWAVGLSVVAALISVKPPGQHNGWPVCPHCERRTLPYDSSLIVTWKCCHCEKDPHKKAGQTTVFRQGQETPVRIS